MVKYVPTYTKGSFKKNQQRTYQMMLMRFLFILFFFIIIIFFIKSMCCRYPFELHRQVDAIQMWTNNICLYKEVDKKYTSCNLKTTNCLTVRL